MTANLIPAKVGIFDRRLCDIRYSATAPFILNQYNSYRDN
jgi:hypothetical protein